MADMQTLAMLIELPVQFTGYLPNTTTRAQINSHEQVAVRFIGCGDYTFNGMIFQPITVGFGCRIARPSQVGTDPDPP